MARTDRERRLERGLGDRWADRMRRHGWWVQKLPASSMGGLPDWRVGHPGLPFPPRFVEAKRAGPRTSQFALRRSQLTAAQRFFLERECRAGGSVSVLILGPESYLEVAWEDVGQGVTWAEFDAASVPYDD